MNFASAFLQSIENNQDCQSQKDFPEDSLQVNNQKQQTQHQIKTDILASNNDEHPTFETSKFNNGILSQTKNNNNGNQVQKPLLKFTPKQFCLKLDQELRNKESQLRNSGFNNEILSLESLPNHRHMKSQNSQKFNDRFLQEIQDELAFEIGQEGYGKINKYHIDESFSQRSQNQIREQQQQASQQNVFSSQSCISQRNKSKYDYYRNPEIQCQELQGISNLVERNQEIQNNNNYSTEFYSSQHQPKIVNLLQMNIHQRQQIWEEKSRSKRDMLKKSCQQNEVKECSFQPTFFTKKLNPRMQRSKSQIIKNTGGDQLNYTAQYMPPKPVNPQEILNYNSEENYQILKNKKQNQGLSSRSITPRQDLSPNNNCKALKLQKEQNNNKSYRQLYIQQKQQNLKEEQQLLNQKKQTNNSQVSDITLRALQLINIQNQNNDDQNNQLRHFQNQYNLNLQSNRSTSYSTINQQSKQQISSISTANLYSKILKEDSFVNIEKASNKGLNSSKLMGNSYQNEGITSHRSQDRLEKSLNNNKNQISNKLKEYKGQMEKSLNKKATSFYLLRKKGNENQQYQSTIDYKPSNIVRY